MYGYWSSVGKLKKSGLKIVFLINVCSCSMRTLGFSRHYVCSQQIQPHKAVNQDRTYSKIDVQEAFSHDGNSEALNQRIYQDSIDALAFAALLQ